MLVTPERNRQNRNHALASAGATAVISVVAGWFFHPILLLLVLSPFVYWLVRRRCVRRLRIMEQPFPALWEQALQSHVAFFRMLPGDEKERFRQLVKVFLDEVRISGIQTEVDDTIRVLVAASAAIPVFGFHDWEYHRLGEVLIYPRIVRRGVSNERECRREHSWHGRTQANTRCNDSFQAVSPRGVRYSVPPKTMWVYMSSHTWWN